MNSIAFIAFTRRGYELAGRLADGLREGIGYPRSDMRLYGPARFADNAYGSLATWTAEHFAADDALVFVGATGIAVRAIASHVADKFADPAVVAIDEAGRYAVPLLSGHVGGANALARHLAALTGGRAVISTATDVNGVFAVDEWAANNGLTVVERDIAKEISTRLLEGGRVGYAMQGELRGDASQGDGSQRDGGFVSLRPVMTRIPRPPVTDVVALGGEGCPSDLGFVVGLNTGWSPFEQTLHLVPCAVTVGVGCRKDVDPVVLARAVDEELERAGVSPLAVSSLATIDVKRGEPAIQQLAAQRGWDLRYYSAEELESVPGDFEESAFVEAAVGVGNVCERAVLAEGGILLQGKQAHDGVTVALAFEGKESVPMQEGLEPSCAGMLAVVGLGPGGGLDLAGRARAALAACDAIVGYPVYVDLVRAEFPDKEYFTTPMRKEVERCRMALELASAGRRVALVCSGDPGVYGMAGLVLELAEEYPDVEVGVMPGITAANGGAAVLGAPLMHDWCCISLSDLLTPWEAIERRLRAAAESGLVIALYNPSSRKRAGYLRRTCDILLETLSPNTVCGIARNIGREGQEARVLSLGELRETPVDMFTTVFVGNSQTRELAGRMVTPRGYRLEADGATCGTATAPEILLFGGTAEGRELAEWLSARGRCQVVACCATEYGGELVSGLPGVSPVVGPLDDAAKDALMVGHDFACIIDATHPYATHISESVRTLADAYGLPCIRVVRDDAMPGEFMLVGSMEEAAAYAASRPGNILLTTGTNDLATFVTAVDDFAERLYARILPVPESLRKARDLGVPASRIVAMQGPFSQAMNSALMRELNIAMLVTKASGEAGGFPEKIRAARECGVQVVVVGRPAEESGFTLEQAKRELEVRYGA